MYQEAELRGFLTSEETLTGTLTDTQGLSGVLSAGVGAAGDYNNLINKPRINNIVIEGNKTPLQYGFPTVAVTGSYTDLVNKPNIPTKTSELTNDSGFITDSGLATVATTGDYDDLLNKPTIPAAQVNSDWNASSGVAEILNKPSLATVATTGDYDDLLNKPTIPAAQVNSDWNASSGVAEILNKPVIPAAQVNSDWNASSGVAQILNKPTIPTKTSELTNDSGYVQITGLATVATTGSYNDLSDKPDLTTKMDKANPTGTGSLSLNKASGSTLGNNAVTVGLNGTASGNYSLVGGNTSTASAFASIALGDHTQSSGEQSISIGQLTRASGTNSIAEGLGTKANRRSQHVLGEYNVEETGTATTRGTYVEIVGNGTSMTPSNARTLDWQGNETLAGDLTIKGNKSVYDAIKEETGTVTAGSNISILRQSLYKIGNIKFLNMIFQRTGSASSICDLPSGFNPTYNTDFHVGCDDNKVYRARLATNGSSIELIGTPPTNTYCTFSITFV